MSGHAADAGKDGRNDAAKDAAATFGPASILTGHVHATRDGKLYAFEAP